MPKKNFLNVPQKPVKTSIGNFDFPLLYSDVDGVFANFWIDYDVAINKLKGTGLRPAVRPLSSKAMATLAFFEYRNCSAGVYNEVAVAIHAYPEKMGQKVKLSPLDFFAKAENRKIGTYITDLPVTQKWAMVAGVEIYGYPKWVADIPLSFEKKYFDGEVIDPKTKQKMFSLNGNYSGPYIKLPCLDVMSYSVKAGRILKTAISTDGYWKIYSGKGFRLNASGSQNYSAKNIRELGLNDAEPFSIQRTVNFRSILYLGEILEQGA